MSIILNGTTIQNIIVKDRSGNTLCSDVQIVKVGDTTVFTKEKTQVIFIYYFSWEQKESYIECGETYYNYYPSAPTLSVIIINKSRPVSSISFTGYIDLYENGYGTDTRIINCPNNSKGSLSANGKISLDGERSWTRNYYSNTDEPSVSTKTSLTATITFTDGGTTSVSLPNLSSFYADISQVLYHGYF